MKIDYSKDWNVAEFSMVNKEVFNSSEKCVRIIKNHDAHELGKKFTLESLRISSRGNVKF